MIKGKVGRTRSGFRSIEVHAAEGKEFVGIEAEVGTETATGSVILSGHAVSIRPKNWPLESPQVNRIKGSDIGRWLKPKGGDSGELVVAEDVVVDLGKGNYICGPNGGILWERPCDSTE